MHARRAPFIAWVAVALIAPTSSQKVFTVTDEVSLADGEQRVFEDV